MSLTELGFDENVAKDDAVAILVGPNGAGKSFYMLALAETYRSKRNVTVISNTTYGRLNSLRKVNRLSAGRAGPSPSTIIKRAIAKTLDKESSEYYQLSSILEYCNYSPRFGFSLKGCKPKWPGKFEALVSNYGVMFSSSQEAKDYETAKRFIERWDLDDILWIDSSRSVHEFSMSREFAAILRCEKFLKKIGVITDIQVHLSKRDGVQFELNGASSGELSLISSLVFLATTVEENSVVLIDEPENSLHPSWQREYVGKIFAALGYRNVSVVIATHSPMLVTGAITERPDLVSVFEVTATGPERIDLGKNDIGSSGIEAILWKVFDVVTPANHFVSEEIVEAVNKYERNQINKSEVVQLIKRMQHHSFDHNQEQFFTALLLLVDKVEAHKNGHSNGAST